MYYIRKYLLLNKNSIFFIFLYTITLPIPMEKSAEQYTLLQDLKKKCAACY